MRVYVNLDLEDPRIREVREVREGGSQRRITGPD